MSEWQPIKTAPKDGTDILACEPVDGLYMMSVCCWQDAEFWDPKNQRKKIRKGWMIAGADETYPTHWMPLPPPPSSPNHP